MSLKTQQKISPKIISLVFGVLLLCFALGFWALAWEEPGEAPPGDNVPAPLNVGTDDQVKSGALSFSTFYDSDPTYYVDPDGSYSAILSGKVGIGVLDPGTFKLYVDGKIRSALISESDSDDTVATKGYVDAANGGGGGGASSLVAISAKSTTKYTHANAAKYCYDLSASAEAAMDGDTTTEYSDWRLPSFEEGCVFAGTIVDPDHTDSWIWTTTVYEAASPKWFTLMLTSNTKWSTQDSSVSRSVRCVRGGTPAANGGMPSIIEYLKDANTTEYVVTHNTYAIMDNAETMVDWDLLLAQGYTKMYFIIMVKSAAAPGWCQVKIQGDISGVLFEITTQSETYVVTSENIDMTGKSGTEYLFASARKATGYGYGYVRLLQIVYTE